MWKETYANLKLFLRLEPVIVITCRLTFVCSRIRRGKTRQAPWLLGLPARSTPRLHFTTIPIGLYKMNGLLYLVSQCLLASLTAFLPLTIEATATNSVSTRHSFGLLARRRKRRAFTADASSRQLLPSSVIRKVHIPAWQQSKQYSH